jgi:hypothetical protein
MIRPTATKNNKPKGRVRPKIKPKLDDEDDESPNVEAVLPTADPLRIVPVVPILGLASIL